MIQRAAQVFGVVLLLVGVLGFVATGMSMNADMATAPKLLGLFPVNALHNVVHILLGVWGLLAARTVAAATQFAKMSAGIYLVLALLGFVAPTMFGLVPLGGNDIWLHAILGIVLLAVALRSGKKVASA